MTFETLGYCDRLLEHLELSSHRRRRLKDLFVSVRIQEARLGVISEG